VLKVLDACAGAFDRFWVFAAGLTNVEVELIVTDTATGEVKTYKNALQHPFSPIQDTGAFATCDAPTSTFGPPPGAPPPMRASNEAREDAAWPPATTAELPSWALEVLDVEELEVARQRGPVERAGNCAPSATALCLNNGRFHVTAEWETRDGQTGNGNAVALTADTGYFWFFNQSNVELVTKVLNACGGTFNRYWVFAAGLTDVEVTLTVTDTMSGAVKTYFNPQRNPFQPVQDINAFATCP
jgi:hypothetical protein